MQIKNAMKVYESGGRVDRKMKIKKIQKQKMHYISDDHRTTGWWGGVESDNTNYGACFTIIFVWVIMIHACLKNGMIFENVLRHIIWLN